ncbi:MAG: NAD(P)H-quinone oxidoreductase [Isosphaeraceae bacterium]
MKAVVIARKGGVEALEVRDVPAPEPLGGELRIRVRAAGINRADVMQAQGHYPAPPGAPADIPGLEYAGEVADRGPGCIGPLKEGDRVFGIVAGGGLAEFVTVHERMAVPIPDRLDFDEAACIPEAFLTAHDALTTQGNLQPGERVLIQAAAGGVGSAAVQIAHAMGCQVFGTSRTADKLAVLREYGLGVAIDTSKEDFAAVVRDRTRGEGVHVVIDHIGAAILAGNLDALANRGRLVLVGLLGGPKGDVNLYTLLRKRLTIVGTTLRARPIEEKIAATRLFAECVVPWLAEGRIRPILDGAYPLDRIREAEERLTGDLSLGKIVVRP